MKISKEEAVYAVLKMVVDDKISFAHDLQRTMVI